MLAVAAALLGAAVASLVLHVLVRNETAGWAIGSVALFLVFSGLAVSLVVRKRKRMLCDPLIQIAQTAKAVALFHDYSLRVGKSADDEMRVPIDALNEMFGAIERRDAELARRREALEEEICLRNGEFRTVRARLQAIRNGSCNIIGSVCVCSGKVAGQVYRVKTRLPVLRC